jgi:hypothetical protein
MVRRSQDVHTFTYYDSRCLVDGASIDTTYTCTYFHILEIPLLIFNAPLG